MGMIQIRQNLAFALKATLNIVIHQCIGDDLEIKGLASFPKAAKAKPEETVVFAWVVFKSRADRDRVNAKVMRDKRLAVMMSGKDMPFDGKRLIYGGFKVLVEV